MNVVNPKQSSNDFPETQNKSTNGRCGSSRTTFPGKRSSWVFSMWAPQLLETESTYHGAVLFLGDWWRLFSPNIIDSSFFPNTGIQISWIPIWYRSYIMNDIMITYDNNQLLWNTSTTSYNDNILCHQHIVDHTSTINYYEIIMIGWIWCHLPPTVPTKSGIHSRGPFGATPLMRGMAPSAV